MNITKTIANIFGAKALAAATLLATATLATAADHIITIGYATSPVLQVLKGSRTSMDARVLAKERKEKNNGRARQAEANLQSARFLAIDLAEVDPSDEDIEMIDAARAVAVPIVVENASIERMAKIFGIGTDNSVVVVESDPNIRQTKLNLADAPELDSPPGYESLPQANANFGDRVLFADDIISKRPFTRGARNQALGFCAGNNVPATACQEFVIETPPVHFCPKKYISGSVGAGGNYTYNCVNGMATIDPQWEAGLYAARDSNNTPYKYVFVRATGGWAITAGHSGGRPPSMDTNSRRFPFFGTYEVSMTPLSGGTVGALPRTWRLLASAPSNTLGASNVTVTTGFSVSAGGNCGAQGGNNGGPNCGGTLGVSYSASTATSTEIKDWSVKNYSSTSTAYFNYYMSSVTCPSVKSVDDSLLKREGVSSLTTGNARLDGINGLKVCQPPTWSMIGRQANGSILAEGVWRGQTDEFFMLNLLVAANVMDLGVFRNEYDHQYSYQFIDRRGSLRFFGVNPARVTF